LVILVAYCKKIADKLLGVSTLMTLNDLEIQKVGFIYFL